MSYAINKLRSTVFSSNAIPFKPDILKKMQEVVNDEDLILIRNQMPMAGVNDMFYWQIYGEKKKLSIIIMPQKIDIICDNDSYKEEEFCKLSSDILSALLSVVKFNINRMAFAPTYLIVFESESDFPQFASQYLKDINYSDAAICNIEFSQTYKPKRIIHEKEYSMNFVTKFTTINPVDDKNHIGMLIDLDINTTPVTGIMTFSDDELKSFYDNANNWTKDYCKYLKMG